MKLPDITPEEIKGDVVFLVGVAASLGFKIDGDVSTGLATGIVAAFALVKVVNDLVGTWRRKNRIPLALAEKQTPPINVTVAPTTPPLRKPATTRPTPKATKPAR